MVKNMTLEEFYQLGGLPHYGVEWFREIDAWRVVAIIPKCGSFERRDKAIFFDKDDADKWAEDKNKKITSNKIRQIRRKPHDET